MDLSHQRTLLRLKLILARLSLWAERLSISFQWFILWVAAFIILALFNYSHDVLAGIFWVGAFLLFCLGFKLFLSPSLHDAEETLERKSDLIHRPLRSRDDAPVTDLSKDGEGFWEGEKARKFAQLKFTKWIGPDFHFVRRDPYALRIGLILLLIVGIIIAGPTAPARIATSLLPFSSSLKWANTSSIKLIITPPGYTSQPQLVLTGRPSEPIIIPQGSIARVVAQSWVGGLQIVMAETAAELKRDGKTDAYTAEVEIPEVAKIAVTQFGFPRLSIPVRYIADQSPSILLRDKPQVVAGGQLRLPLTVQDDYGIKLIRVRAILSPDVKSHPLGEPVYEEQSVIVNMKGEPVEINPRFDLTGHPWAGYPVSLLVEAEDYAGQVAVAEPVDMTLPERNFHHPVARDIVEARKSLIRNGEVAAGAVALQIVQSLARPGRYDWDSVVTLSLRSSLSRLGYDPTRASCESVVGTLWQTALRLEDGNLTTTQNDLRKALENLQRAVQNKASPEEISELMQQFREALSRHLQNLQKEMAKRAEAGELMPITPDMMTQVFDPSALGDFLSQLENELMSGDIDTAMQKLESLSKMSDMLNPAMAQPMPEDVKKMMKTMQDLQKVIDRQQSLLDKTRSKQDQTSQAEEKEQGLIQDELSGVKSDADKANAQISESLNDADKAMEEAQGKLAGNDPQGSLPSQQEALDKLREGKQGMQQALKERMKNMMGMSMNPMPQGQDPLGRNSSNQNGQDIFNNSVKIPTGAERKKADEILKTIRERSSDLTRPQAEREYYQRLLRQW